MPKKGCPHRLSAAVPYTHRSGRFTRARRPLAFNHCLLGMTSPEERRRPPSAHASSVSFNYKKNSDNRVQPPTRCLENGRETGASMAAADLFWKQRDAESLTFAD